MWHNKQPLHLFNLFYQPPPPFTFLAPSPCLSPFGPFHPTGLDKPPPLLSIIGSSALFPRPHYIVTVQIYLSRSAKRTGTSGSPTASSVTARSATSPQQTSQSSKAGMARKGGAVKVPPVRKPPSFNLQLKKSGSLSSFSSLDTPSYRSPIKSPSQYFQICY